MNPFANYSPYLADKYDNLPRGRYASLFIIRKTLSETIFRTEGSGEGLVKEMVSAGSAADSPVIRRVVISKRKQTAVERRTGRELLREHNLLLKPAATGRNAERYDMCMLNTNTPCERCIDCYLYGFAAGGGGAQKSRVLTDDAYSLGSVARVTARRTFNATFDNGTMRNPVTGDASTSINEDEYVLPQTHFLDIETLKDVTLPEFYYVVGNVMRSARYGAISSRLGRVQNKIVAIAFSDCELFSNLELTQTVYDLVCDLLKARSRVPDDEDDLPFPLADKDVEDQVHAAIDRLIGQVFSRRPMLLQGDRLQAELQAVQALYAEPEIIAGILKQQTDNYPKN